MTTMRMLTEKPEELVSDVKETLDELATNRDLEISVFLENGDRIYTKNELFNIPFSNKEGMTEVRITDTETGQNTPADSTEKDYHVMVYRKRLASSPPPLIIQISKNLGGEDRFLKILREFLLFADLFGLGVSFLVGFSISRRILKPVDEIANTARRISAQDLTERIPETGPEDELTRLSRAFNDMLNRLQNSFVKQTRFVSDASHELRTPLSIINGYVSMLGRWAKTNPDLLEESIAAIKSETSRMMTLIEKLLFLARSDNSTLKISREPVNLFSLVEGAVQDMKYLAPEREIILREKEELEITGDPDMLKQMLFIFLDNSIRYSAEEKPIEIGISREIDRGVIQIRDFGAGIDPEKREAIFDRFYRIDDSRTKGSGGAGLGLSIAKEIIDLHGGSVEVESSPGDGSEFFIRLPLN